ncbi:hypothetical protein DERF_000018 [Dermatophagoides farinae]|uniref:Uncharacterized protein n=1 Tax=Dermatophagoides farinae TaxID=6954 RepID=A0A922I995_DERFA|nr:hypothetical protein DERF_000018 [Dermatophagoides farinae]
MDWDKDLWIYNSNNNNNDDDDDDDEPINSLMINTDDNDDDDENNKNHHISRLDNIKQRINRFVRRSCRLFITANLIINTIIIIYLWSMNMSLIRNYCPHHKWTEILLAIYLIAGGIIAVYLVLRLKSYSLLWTFHLTIWLAIGHRLQTTSRYFEFEFNEEELMFYRSMLLPSNKFLAISECVIGLNIWLCLVYIMNFFGTIFLILFNLIPSMFQAFCYLIHHRFFNR